MWFMRPSNRSCDPWETMWQVMWSTSDHVIDERPCDRSCDPPVIMWSTRDHVTGHVIHQWSCDPQETMWQVMWSTSDHVIYERPCDRSCDLPNLLCYMQPNIAYVCVCLLIWDHNPPKRFYVLKWFVLNDLQPTVSHYRELEFAFKKRKLVCMCCSLQHVTHRQRTMVHLIMLWPKTDIYGCEMFW